MCLLLFFHLSLMNNYYLTGTILGPKRTEMNNVTLFEQK